MRPTSSLLALLIMAPFLAVTAAPVDGAALAAREAAYTDPQANTVSVREAEAKPPRLSKYEKYTDVKGREADAKPPRLGRYEEYGIAK